MATDLDPAIAAMERRREEALQKVAEFERTINTLCEEAGLPPRYAEKTAAGSSKLVQISDDTFYGQKMTPAMRTFLEMRRAQGLGPATAREIYEALKAGGYVFEAKDAEVSLVSMRALLRTQPLVFHRLPQGTWGLTVWYPDAKKPKEEPEKKTGKPQRLPLKRVRLPLRAPKRERVPEQSGQGQADDE